jgi:ribosomal protein S18 acetylase RimI-like enzyme
VETLPDRAGASAAGGNAGWAVRPAKPGDARSFLEMWRGVVAEKRFVRSDTVQRSVAYYRRHYFRRSWTYDQASLVAIQGDRVVAHLHVAREEGPITRHVASLGMAVAPEWRGKGVGSALLAEAIRWAKEMGVEKLALSVYPQNDAALALYRKFGFQEEGRLTGHSKKSIGYLDEIVMGLWLNARRDDTA